MVSSVIGPIYQVLKHFPRRTFTVRHPFVAIKPPARIRGRPLLDLERCVGCGVCVYICAPKALSLVTVAGRKLPMFHCGRCVFCGFCVDLCPKSALTLTDSYELAEYGKDALEFTPEQFSKSYIPSAYTPEQLRKRKLVSVKIIDERGVSHG